MTRLVVALDTVDLSLARAWAVAVAPHCAMTKLGLAFFCAHGGPGVRAIGGDVFLDLKFCDIPATVAGAMDAVLPLGARLLTLHAAGGPAMIAAARERAEAFGLARPSILAVTVLTSLGAEALRDTGVSGDPRQQAVRLGRLAMAAGADGLVCSARELSPLRDALGTTPVLVVPGVRPAGFPPDDQTRIATPAEAARDGADYVVVGRPITAAADPAAAAAAIAAELRS